MRAKILLIACAIVTLSACGKREDPAALSQSGDYAAESAKVESAAAPSAHSVKQQLSSSANTYSDGERQFIRKADVKFRVKDVYQSALAIEDIVGNIGGFVEKNTIQSNVEREQTERIGDGKALKLTAYTLNGELTVRVPSAKTQEFLRLIAGQIAFLDQRSFTAQDAQFELLRQKLGIKRNQESQQQLGQIVEEGGKIDKKADVIVTQNETKGARDEAMVTEKEFADQVAFSEIKLALYQHTQVSQIEVPDVSSVFEMSSPGFFYRLSQSFKSGWHWGLETLIDLTKIWPFWLVLIAAIVIVRKWRQRSKSTAHTE
jgi:hypothetical protein